MAGWMGSNGYFALADAPTGSTTPAPVITDISRLLTAVSFDVDVAEGDGTTFQPGVKDPAKEPIPGALTYSIVLSANYDKQGIVEDFFSKVRGLDKLEYYYGPFGKELGMPGVTGEATAMKFVGPTTSVTGVITASLELRATSRISGTFDATGIVTPNALPGGEGGGESRETVGRASGATGGVTPGGGVPHVPAGVLPGGAPATPKAGASL